MKSEYEAYRLGYAYGSVARVLPEAAEELAAGAAKRPRCGLAKIIGVARERGVMTKALTWRLGKITVGVSMRDDAQDQSADKQGQWQMGYLAALNGTPYYDADLRLAREDAGLSQQELAEIIGVKQSNISRWERGHVQPTQRNMDRLRSALARYF